MKIGLFSHFFHNEEKMSFGPYPMIFKLTKGLSRYFEITVFAGKTKDTRTSEKINGMKIIRLFSPEIKCLPLSKFLIYGLNSLKEIKKEKPDLLHSQNIDGAIAFKFNKKIPKIFTVKSLVEGHKESRGKLTNRIKDILIYTTEKFYESMVLNSVDIIVTPSIFSKNEVLKYYPKLKKGIRVIYNATEPSIFKPINVDKLKNKLNLNRNKIIFYAGGQSIRKGADVVLKAFALAKKEIKNLKLLIADTNNLNKFLNIIKDFNINLKDIVLLGGIKHKMMPHYYNLCDIFVHPSFHETFGSTLIEAMACKKPVITSNCTAMPEVVTNKEGILVERGDYKKFAEAIVYLLKNPKKAKKLGKNGRERVIKLFSIDRMINEYKKLYEEVI